MTKRRTITLLGVASAALLSGISPGMGQYVPPPQLAPGVNYMVPNYANSPILTKFVDTLPGLTAAGANTLGNYIPVAVADTTSFPGSAYYEIGLVDYVQVMHSDMPLGTKLRGYVQISTTVVPGAGIPLFYADGVTPIMINGVQAKAVDKPSYLGPVILATKDVPTVIKFYNLLPAGAAGDLFLPVDVSFAGAGTGPDNTTLYSENRATLHLHGGDNPWVSDGTALQWITPADETNPYKRGASAQNVPTSFMPDPGPGAMTFYWPNGMSGRLMFYHDHAQGMTRLNPYAGEAAGYLLTDPTERALNSLAPGGEIPLVIQDKAFVSDGTVPATFPAGAIAPAATTAVDPLWASNPNWGQTKGSLWWPHVYMPNQNPNDLSGSNPFGRWDYGAWFWPIFPSGVPPQVSSVPETFVDTPIVNGTAYPKLNVSPTAYRFRILNAANDRYWNLQMYVASPIISSITVTAPGSGYTAPVVTITDPTPGAKGATASAVIGVGTGAITAIAVGTPGAGYTAPVVTITDTAPGTGSGATATATVDATGAITAITVTAPGTGYTAPVVTIADTAPGTGSGATATATWQTIGTITAIDLITVGSGYAAPVVTITDPTGTGAAATANVYSQLTEVGMVPASKTAGISFPPLWSANDTPGMIPNILDGRQGGVPDPATRGPSFIHIGSEGGIAPQAVELPTTPIGYEQNKRSITVLNVFDHTLLLGPAERADVIVDFSQFGGKTLILYNDAPAPVPAGDPRNDYYTCNPDMTPQGGAPPTLPGFGPNTRTIMQINVAPGTGTAVSVPTVNSAVAAAFAATQPAAIVPPNTFSRIADTSMTFSNMTIQMQPKTIQELFDPLGRMNSTLGVELPFTTAAIQTTIPYGFLDPVTEVFPDGVTQLWKITHNGVDTHAIHFHLFNVQVINRIGWDGAIKPPSPEELGWKETVRMNPLEDIVVAMRIKIPTVPFQQPNNSRPLDPNVPLGARTVNMNGTAANIFFGQDPFGIPVAVSNVMANFGHEYTWHCHLLGHEENDMMRPTCVAVPPQPPTGLVQTMVKGKLVLTWVDASPDETGYMVQKKVGTGPWTTIGTTTNTTFTDPAFKKGTVPLYQVLAVNTVGSGVPGYPNVTVYSLPSNVAAAPLGATTLTVSQALLAASPVVLKWTYSAADQTGFTIERSTSSTFGNGTVTINAGNVLTYTDAAVVVGLRRNTTYYYRVTPTNANGSGLPSNVASLLVHP